MWMRIVSPFALINVFETAPLLSGLTEVVNRFQKGTWMDGLRKNVTLIFL